MSFKICPPTEEVEQRTRRGAGKYAEIYKAASAAGGKWMPVEFETKVESVNFAATAATHRTMLFEAKKRGLTVYVRYLGVKASSLRRLA